MLDAPYRDLSGRTPYLCQFHTHTTESDGLDTPAQVMAAYESVGFDVVALTDHGMTPDPHICTPDPGGHGMLYIPGYEWSTGLTHISGNTLDVVVLNPTDPSTPLDDGTWGHTPVPVEDVLAQGDVTFWAHPRNQDFSAWYGTTASRCMHPDVLFNRMVGGDSFIGTEGYGASPAHLVGRSFWSDAKGYFDALDAGYRFGYPGTSDNHNIAYFLTTYDHRYCTGTVVYATERTIPAIMSALRDGMFHWEGRFGGLKNMEIIEDGTQMTVSITGASAGYDFWVWGPNYKVLGQKFDTGSMTYVYSGGEGYIYFYIYARVQDNTNGFVMYTNPTWIGSEHHKVSRAAPRTHVQRGAGLATWNTNRAIQRAVGSEVREAFPRVFGDA